MRSAASIRRIVFLLLAVALIPACSRRFTNRNTTVAKFTPNFLLANLRIDNALAGFAAQNAEICCDGTRIYVVWQDFRNGNSDVFFNFSPDNGATWQPVDIRIDNAPGATNIARPRICCDGLNVYVVWEDLRNGNSDVFFNRSTDGGVSWLGVDTQLNTDGAGLARSLQPEICCDGLRVYVTWQDERNGGVGTGEDIFLNASADGGTTFLVADVRLDTDVAGAADSENPRICCNGLNVYVAWDDQRAGNADIHLNSSTDGAATFQVADVRLDTDVAGAAASTLPEICCDLLNVYVVWGDLRNGNQDIYFNSSSNGGVTFQAGDVRLNTDAAGTATSLAPVICCGGQNVHVAWLDERLGGVGDGVVFSNSSTNGGVTWLVADVQVGQFNANAQPANLRICCSEPNVYVVLSDFRNDATVTNNDIFFNASIDGGRSWLAADVRLDTDAAGAATSVGPRLCCAGLTVSVVWVDGQLGDDDIFFNRTSP